MGPRDKALSQVKRNAFLDVILREDGLVGLTPGMAEEAVWAVVPAGEELHQVWSDEAAQRGEPALRVEHHADGHNLGEYDPFCRIRTRVHCRGGALSMVNVGVASIDKAAVKAIASKVRAYFKKRLGAPEELAGAADQRHRYTDGASTVDVERGFRPGSYEAGIPRMDELRVTWQQVNPAVAGELADRAFAAIATEPAPTVGGGWVNTPESEIRDLKIRVGPKPELRRLEGDAWVATKPLGSIEGRDLDLTVLSLRAEVKKQQCRRLEVEVYASEPGVVDAVAGRLADHYAAYPGDGVVSHQNRKEVCRRWPEPPLDWLLVRFERG